MLQTEIISIFTITKHFYIHIPFCRQKCPYCKFALTPIFDEFKKRRYIEYLKKEIKEYFQSSGMIDPFETREKRWLKHFLFSSLCEFYISVDDIFERIWNCLSTASFSNSKNKSNTDNKMKHGRFRKLLLLLAIKVRKCFRYFNTFNHKSKKNSIWKINEDPELNSGWQKTIYFWGWTPSILNIEEIREILECFPFYRKIETEITLESNPEDITKEYIQSILELWINRISVGIQTLNEKSLTEIHRSDRNSIIIALQNIWSALLGSDQTRFSSVCEFYISVDDIFERIWNCLSVASFSNSKNKSNTDNKMKHGRFRKLLLLLVSKVRTLTQKYIIKNRISINTDFILGLPYVQSWETLAGIKKLHTEFPFITHTSVYMLEDDIYPKDWKANSISENELRNEFLEIIEYFTCIWWNHYELSNWAKPGYESVHNRAYWDHSNSRGFGLSSASYEDGERWNNDESFVQYYRWNLINREILTSEQVEIENMMFGLRTWGWNIGTHTITTIQKIQKLIDSGLIEMDNDTIKPTKTWIFVIDYIMSELIDI